MTSSPSSAAVPSRWEAPGPDGMGLILDSSVLIFAERRGDTVEKLIEQVVSAVGDQDAALSSLG